MPLCTGQQDPSGAAPRSPTVAVSRPPTTGQTGPVGGKDDLAAGARSKWLAIEAGL
jgi:hypothetical protein